MEGTEEGISELEYRTIEITKSEQRGGNRLKRTNSSSGTHGTKITDLAFLS